MKRIATTGARITKAALAGLVCAAMCVSGTIQGSQKSDKAKGPDKSTLPRVAKLLASSDKKLGEESFWFDGVKVVDPGEDKTVSPYFFVAGGDPATDLLPLRSTSADVRISGPIASVRLRQVFGNDGDDPIEAVYVFPASTRAAVHGMGMKVAERRIEAQIEKRKDAKAKYEKAKSEGKVASLLDQERPNVFTMRVANIMPGDEIEVDLEYSELIEHEEGVYGFVYPAVVGPRYAGGADLEADEWMANPYTGENEKELYTFEIRVAVDSGLPLREIRSPSHEIDVTYSSPSVADVRLAGEGGGDRDFVLEYRLAGEKIDGEVLLHDHGDESFFVLLMEPPALPDAGQVLPGEYIFLLDVSGSMSGFPLETAKTLVKELLADLGPEDHFNIVTFAGSAGLLSPVSLPVTEKSIEAAIHSVDGLSGGGGTELMDGLERAYSIPHVPGDVSRTVVVVTDGYVGVEAQAFKLIRDNLGDANLFAFGIGSSVNRYLIECMARAGYGEPFVVTDASKAEAEAGRFRRYIEKPVLTDISVSYDGFDAYDVAPAAIPDLMAQRPLVIFGKFQGMAGGSITVRGKRAGGDFERVVEVDPSTAGGKSAPIRHLWARKWVDVLSDQLHVLPDSKPIRNGITRLGLHYSMMTAFTSFVAVDTVVSNKTGKVEKVKQPLPLPAGVSNLAVGDSVSKGSLGGGGGSSGGSIGGVGYGKGSPASFSFSLKASSPPLLSPGAPMVLGSVNKTTLKSSVKKALGSLDDVKELLKKAGCASTKLTIKMVFDSSGKLKDLVVTTDPASSCSCDQEAAALVETALEKGLGKLPDPAFASVSVTYPLVIAP